MQKSLIIKEITDWEDIMQKKVYAVRVGRTCGLFTNWPECQKQVAGFPGARYKSFTSAQEALAWLAGSDVPHKEPAHPARPLVKPTCPRPAAVQMPLRPLLDQLCLPGQGKGAARLVVVGPFRPPAAGTEQIGVFHSNYTPSFWQ